MPYRYVSNIFKNILLSLYTTRTPKHKKYQLFVQTNIYIKINFKTLSNSWDIYETTSSLLSFSTKYV